MQLIGQLDCSDSVLMSTDEMSILCFAWFDWICRCSYHCQHGSSYWSCTKSRHGQRQWQFYWQFPLRSQGRFFRVPVQLQVYCLGFSWWRWMAVILSIFGWKLLEIRCFNYFHPKWRSETKLNSWLLDSLSCLNACSKRFHTDGPRSTWICLTLHHKGMALPPLQTKSPKCLFFALFSDNQKVDWHCHCARWKPASPRWKLATTCYSMLQHLEEADSTGWKLWRLWRGPPPLRVEDLLAKDWAARYLYHVGSNASAQRDTLEDAAMYLLEYVGKRTIQTVVSKKLNKVMEA